MDIGRAVIPCVTVGIIAGIYPSFMFQGFTVSRVLTGSVSKGMKTNSLD